jgi:Domain of unknown function (DUF4350)
VNARTRDSALLALGIVALVAVAFARDRAQPANARSIFSSYDNGPNGYRALYDVLKTAGVPVRRLRSALTTFDGNGTLVVSENTGDPSRIAFDRADRSALQRFVMRGGRLVALTDTFDGPRDLVPRVGQTKTSVVRIATASVALRIQTGVRAVDAPAAAAFGASPHATALLLAEDGNRVAIAYPIGKGTVIASTSPASFGNAKLLQRDNLRFAYAVLAGHGPVTFDEYAHGYNDDVSFWQVVPRPVKLAVALTVAIVLVGLIGANVPFAPPVPLDAPDERNTTAYVRAMAGLLRRARARTDAMSALIRSVRRAPSSPQRVAIVGELDRLNVAKPSDAALQRAAWLEFQLRKERV